tara:strand:+ start:1017 stop:1292 length:276 start_codon:yes stop_codon:yes gene_type:complete
MITRKGETKMQVKDVIAQLVKSYGMDDHIMIDWLDHDSIEGRYVATRDGDGLLTLDAWQEACNRAKNSEYLFDMDVARDICFDVERRMGKA